MQAALAELDSEAAKVASLAGSGGAATVGYLPSGTGAVARDVQSKLREMISVKDFGVVGDGATNCTTQLQAANDYCYSVGASLYFPTGTYVASIVNAKVSWVGEGTIRADRINVVAPNLLFDRLTFYSIGLNLFSVGTSASPNPTFTKLAIDFAPSLGGERKAIYGENVDGLTIIGCKITTGGIELIGATNFNISNNRLDRQWIMNTVEGIHASKKSYGIISGNTVLNSTIDAVDLYSSGERTVVIGNRFIGFRDCSAVEAKVILRDDGMSSGDTGYGYTESIIITNNVMRDFSYTANTEISAIFAEYLDLRSTPVFPLDRANAGVLITNNIIEDAYVTNNPAISVEFHGIAYGGSNAVISNNIFRNIYSNNDAGGIFSYAIALGANTTSVAKTVKGVNISGNMISTDSGGIKFGRTTAPVNFYDIVVSGNNFKNDYRTGQSVKRCIAVESGASIYNSIFTGNILETDNTTRRGGFFFSAINPIFTRNIITNNQFIGSSANFKSATYCDISHNMFDCLGYSQTPLTVGVAGTDSKGNTIIGNKFKQADTALGTIDLYQQVGFGVSHNVFTDASLPIRVFSSSTNGLITENISISGGATFVTYSGSSAVTESNNLIVA